MRDFNAVGLQVGFVETASHGKFVMHEGSHSAHLTRCVEENGVSGMGSKWWRLRLRALLEDIYLS